MALELAGMARLYRTPPSRLMQIGDPLSAWCLDEAIAHLTLRLENGDKLRPKKTGGNLETLREMGIDISGSSLAKRPAL